MARLFLQLPFEGPEVVATGALEIDVRLLYANSVLLARSDALALDVHVETAQPTVTFRYGVAPGIEAQLALPFDVDHGGFLDRPIEIVEGWFGFSNPQRRGRPRNEAHYRLTRPDGSGIRLDGGEAGLGDAWAGAKVGLIGGAGRGGAVSFRGALKLPTGRLPFGSEEVDLGGSLLAGWTWTSAALRLQVDGLLPTARLAVVHIRTRAYGAVDVGLTERLGERVALQAQLSGHSSALGGTGVDPVDSPTFYALLGTTVALARAWLLDAAVVENVFSPYRGADITFLVGVRARP